MLFLGLFLTSPLPGFSQTLLGRAAGDFYSAFAKMGTGKRQPASAGTNRLLDDIAPFITEEVSVKLRENLVYRAAFIGYAANQHGIITGITSSAGFAETLNALTGFLMIVEDSGEIKDWTIREISGRYEQLLASSWRHVNPSLFALMLETYCSYKRGDIWQ
jgi:hypothetical protein